MLKLVVLIVAVAGAHARTVTFKNKCNKDIWIAPLTNSQGPTLSPGIAFVGSGESFTYNIPDGGWSGRFWPKTNCDGNGDNCVVGQSVPPCPAEGCQPPAETRLEFIFPPVSAGQTMYDVSLIGGYSMSAEVIPKKVSGSCISTNCSVSLADCPSKENGGVGDLRIMNNGEVVQCMSPCMKWSFPPPYGLGNAESEASGLEYCCPTPPVSPSECRTGSVVNSQYVTLTRKTCPFAYSYAYDDVASLRSCPADTSFNVKIC